MLPHFKMYMNQTRTCLHISAIPQTICTNLEHWLRAIYVADRFKDACVNKTVQFFPLPGTEAVCAQNHEMFVKALVGKMWSSISRSEIGRWWLKKKKKKSLHGVGAAVEGTFLMTLFVTTRYSAHTFAFQHIPVLLREWTYTYLSTLAKLDFEVHILYRHIHIFCHSTALWGKYSYSIYTNCIFFDNFLLPETLQFACCIRAKAAYF